jgi:outer membrane biosynthesis protein TonB
MSYSYPLKTSTPWGVKAAVALLHCFLVLLLAMAKYETVLIPSPKSLVVQTVTLQPHIVKEPPLPVPAPPAVSAPPTPPAPPKEVQKELPPPPAPKPAVKEKPKKQKSAPTPKKQPAKKPSIKKAPPKPSHSPAKKQMEEKRASMVAEAMSSLNRVEKHTPVTSSKMKAAPVRAIGALSAETVEASRSNRETKEPSYYDELVRRLKLSLQLPEYGEVKLELTISRLGKVVRLKVVQAKSKKNANYLEKMIPSVTFPPFGHNFANEKEHTFRLRLCEDIYQY